MSRPRVFGVEGVRTVALRDGRGPPLLIVPGLGCASWMYHRAARALAPHFTVWRYDHPGHGWSGGGLDRIEALAEHLAGFMRVAGLAGAPLLGHSLGGEIALELAARHPELTPALILAAPTGIPENPHPLLQLLHLLRDAPRERPGLLPLALAAYARCGPRRMVQLAYDQRRHLTLPNLQAVTQPVLVALGDRDPIVPAQAATALDALLQDPTRRVFASAHALPDARPQALASAVRRFLGALP